MDPVVELSCKCVGGFNKTTLRLCVVYVYIYIFVVSC